MKEITRTSAQYKEEQRRKQEEKICPECGREHVGFSTRIVEEGFFSIKYYTGYSCRVCGCEWRVREY